MHNHVDHRWIKAFLNKIIRIIICLTLVYTPFFANASAAEKWTIEEISYDNVAKNIKIQAEKNLGPSANDNKYKVKVPVIASAVGSTAAAMIKGGLASAAIIAVVEAAGWVIENGAVVKRQDESETTIPPSSQYYYSITPRDVPITGSTSRSVYEQYVEWWNKGNHNAWGPIDRKSVV